MVISLNCICGEMDITTVFGTVIPGSSPGGCTDKLQDASFKMQDTSFKLQVSSCVLRVSGYKIKELEKFFRNFSRP